MSEVQANAIEFDPDASLDDIDDLPSFAVFHSGAVLVNVQHQERKQVGEHDAWTIKVALKEWIEPAEEPAEGEALAKAGDVMDVAFMLDNAVGLGKMKEFLSPIKKVLGVEKTSECWAGIVGMDLVIVGVRKPKDDGKPQNKGKEGHNYNIKNCLVP